MSNQEIVKLLRDIAAAYIIKNERKYRFQAIAYQKAADSINALTMEVKDLYNEGKLNSIPSIGSSIQSHLIELFKTGKVKHFKDVLRDIPEAIFPLLEVPTFGPKKAFKLVEHFSLKNPKTVINDLEKLAKTGKIAKLDGFGEKSEKDILRAVSEYKTGRMKTKRMLLPFANEIAKRVVEYLKTSKAILKVYPLGSLRRMKPTIGDVDIAVATNNPAEAINYFISYPYKERITEKGDTTASIILSGGYQIDLMTQPPDSFGSLLQHFTGSKNHNIHLREYALQKGLSLSEYGIKKRIGNKTVALKFDSEENFYRAVGLNWIPPEIREDMGEIELAAKNMLPNLVQISDIKGDLHLHSNFPIEPSHDLGQNSMEEMIKKAKELNYKYIGFSEHNPSTSRHTKNEIMSIITKRNKFIDHIRLNTKSIRVINLLEVDILADGVLALDDNVLSTLDGAIVSVHSAFSSNKEKMTKRVIAGLSHPKAKILAHPTGRLLNDRTGYDLDWIKVFKFCREKHKALEINAWPNRLDLPDGIIKMAVENNVKLIIDSDSHSASQMELIEYGVAMARRGWAKKSDILNTFIYNDFISWLKS